MRNILIIVFVLFVFFISCKKEPIVTPEAYQPTLLNLATPAGFPPMPVSSVNPLTKEGVALGRRLFYDPILSSDSTYSCASCHNQQKAFTDSPLKTSVGVHNDTVSRNAMPLFNLAWYPSFFWDGRSASIEDQVFFPVRSHVEMDLNWNTAVQRIRSHNVYTDMYKKAFGEIAIDSVHIAYAIAQFERTFLSYNSKYDKVKRGEAFFDDNELDGYLLMQDFFGGDCLHCHPVESNLLISTLNFRNNGITDAATPDDYPDKGLGAVTGNPLDNGKFKVPSLRNIGLTAPYMHDGRFATLDAVLDFYSTGVHNSANVDPKMEYSFQGGVQLTTDEKAKIKAFLLTLTDSTFITNDDYSSPF